MKQSTLTTLAQSLAGRLKTYEEVHLYVEAPLFLPGVLGVPSTGLIKMRPFEHKEGGQPSWVINSAGGLRKWPQTNNQPHLWPWYSNAGAATGLMAMQELPWLLHKVARKRVPFSVATCPSSCPCGGKGQRRDRYSSRLVVMEAFYPRDPSLRARVCPHLAAPTNNGHVAVAKYLLRVADQFKIFPSARPRTSKCHCHNGRVWYDSARFPGGTQNLVAAAARLANMTPLCTPTSHGWILAG